MYNVQYLPLIKLRNQLIIEVEGKWCRTVFTLHAQAAFAALTDYVWCPYRVQLVFLGILCL